MIVQSMVAHEILEIPVQNCIVRVLLADLFQITRTCKLHTYHTVPIETLVMKVVGCRVTAIAGALLTIIGMVSAAFCTQIWQLVIAYSFVTCKPILCISACPCISR